MIEFEIKATSDGVANVLASGAERILKFDRIEYVYGTGAFELHLGNKLQGTLVNKHPMNLRPGMTLSLDIEGALVVKVSMA